MWSIAAKVLQAVVVCGLETHPIKIFRSENICNSRGASKYPFLAVIYMPVSVYTTVGVVPATW